MGKVKLNIVGYSHSYILEQEYETITLKDIYRYLINKDILLKKLTECKFIHSGQLLELNKQSFDISDTINIYMVIQDGEFKNDVIMKLFNLNLDTELNDTNEEVETVEIKTELCDYFKDEDFINLLKIVKTKPRYLQMVSSYLSHGDIIEDINFDDINIENFEYDVELNILNNDLRPNIQDWDEIKVKKLLVNYEGNVNLTSRYILV